MTEQQISCEAYSRQVSWLPLHSSKYVGLKKDKNQIKLVTYIKCLLLSMWEVLPYLVQQQLHFLLPLFSSSEHSCWFHQNLHPEQGLHNNPWQHTWQLYVNQGSSSYVLLVSAAIRQDGDRNRTALLQLLPSFSKQEAARYGKAPVNDRRQSSYLFIWLDESPRQEL